MVSGTIYPVDFLDPNYERTSKYEVQAVYDMNGHNELIPVSFEQDGPIVRLCQAPFGKTFVQFKYL